MSSEFEKPREDNEIASDPIEKPAEAALAPACTEPVTPPADEELSGQADLDERLAEPVLKGTVGIETAQVVISAFLVLVAALVAYSNAFGLPFHHADEEAIVFNSMAHTVALSPISGKFSGTPMLIGLSYGINWWFAPGNALYFHAVNILLHALNGVLVYLLARRLLRLNKKREDGSGGIELNEPLAMLAGFLVALHPLATESVNIIEGRASLLCSAFSLLSIIFYLRAVDKESLGVGALLISAMSLGFAWAADISALLIAPLILMADWVANGTGAIRRLGIHAAFWGIAIALGAWWVTVTKLEVDPRAVMHPSAPVLPGAKALAFNTALGLGINPSNLSIEHDLPPVSGFLDPEQPGVNPFLAATTGIGIGLVALILVAARSAAGLGLAWFMLSLIPVAYFVPPYTRFMERSLYFGICGLALMLPWAVSKLTFKRATAITASLCAVVLLIAAGAGTFMRNRVWQDPQALWEDAAVKAPEAAEPFIRLGATFYERAQTAYAESQALAAQGERAGAASRREDAQRQFGAAESYLRKAVELNPNDAKLRNSLGITLAIMNKREEAIAMLTEALRLDPSLQECTAQLGALYDNNPSDPENIAGRQNALDYFRRAERLGPLSTDARMNYFTALMRVGDVSGAVTVLAPLAASKNEASSVAEARLKQIAPMYEAIRDTQQKAAAAEKASPGSSEAIRLEAKAMVADGRLLDAFYKLDRLLKLFPDDYDAWLMMGEVRARVGAPDAFIKYYPTPPPVPAGAPPAWLELARRCGEIGRWGAAGQYLAFAATQSDAYALPLLRIGELAEELKQPQIAAAMYEQATKQYQNNPVPWLKLCGIALQSNNAKQARAYLDEAERLGADPAAVAPLREKAGATPEEEKRKPKTVLQ